MLLWRMGESTPVIDWLRDHMTADGSGGQLPAPEPR